MSLSAISLGLLMFFQQVYSPAEFTQVTGASLSARYDSALAQARRAPEETFWVAYRFPVKAGLRINTSENNVSITSTKTSDGIEWIPTDTEPQRVGIFLMVGKGDGLLQRNRLLNLNQNFRVHDRKVYWLGEPSAEESLNLLSTLMDSAPQRFNSSLIHYMTLHESPNVADRLLQIARNDSKQTNIRTSAISYLGREASSRAGEELEKLTNDPNAEIQRQAIAAIARRDDNESIPVLMRIARDHANTTVRKQAIQSLSQKKDPRVLAFLEQMLKKQ
jgi:HEAT repeat protein